MRRSSRHTICAAPLAFVAAALRALVAAASAAALLALMAAAPVAVSAQTITAAGPVVYGHHHFNTTDMAAQKQICDQMQLLAFDRVPFIPTGQSFTPTAFRDTLSGFAQSPFPVFWGVKKS